MGCGRGVMLSREYASMVRERNLKLGSSKIASKILGEVEHFHKSWQHQGRRKEQASQKRSSAKDEQKKQETSCIAKRHFSGKSLLTGRNGGKGTS
jgi:hypothetical protein